MRQIPVAALLLCLAGLAAGWTPAAAGDGQKKSKSEEFQSQFLVFGTVFSEQGAILQGAEIEVRWAGERKVRWRERADRRGEFGVRVPMGAEYEMTITAKGFVAQVRKVDARTGNREDVVFRMAPFPAKQKEGEKKK